ncbi:SAV_915 family protein [Amycolatopsis umgeniensis]|uniref:SseB protein N-terminal domain-containing protein n=1 Tax=Amycolatopsis umgeniensis TaxID=336628 RepID=A0A841B904_9PSEU|nr:hypothetical protein [Amycolatopsis umgeniensis]
MTNPGLPNALFLPTAKKPKDFTRAEIELRRTSDGRMALIAFSSVQRLVECCGEHQPWALVKAEHLGRVYQVQPYDLIVLDSDLPEELRHREALV